VHAIHAQVDTRSLRIARVVSLSGSGFHSRIARNRSRGAVSLPARDAPTSPVLRAPRRVAYTTKNATTLY
jgi:hypothetical protein